VRRGFCSKGHFGQRYLVRKEMGTFFFRISIRHKSLGAEMLYFYRIDLETKTTRDILHFVDNFKVKAEKDQKKGVGESICGKERKEKQQPKSFFLMCWNDVTAEG